VVLGVDEDALGREGGADEDVGDVVGDVALLK